MRGCGPLAQLGEEEPNVQWTFAVRRTTGKEAGPVSALVKGGQESERQAEYIFPKFGPLAQLVEQLAFNQLVEGSNPSRPTIFSVASDE